MSLIGLAPAIETLREGWRGKRFSMKELTPAADVCRMRRIMRPHVEMPTGARGDRLRQTFEL